MQLKSGFLVAKFSRRQCRPTRVTEFTVAQINLRHLLQQLGKPCVCLRFNLSPLMWSRPLQPTGVRGNGAFEGSDPYKEGLFLSELINLNNCFSLIILSRHTQSQHLKHPFPFGLTPSLYMLGLEYSYPAWRTCKLVKGSTGPLICSTLSLVGSPGYLCTSGGVRVIMANTAHTPRPQGFIIWPWVDHDYNGGLLSDKFRSLLLNFALGQVVRQLWCNDYGMV